jgi:hypothetical protein
MNGGSRYKTQRLFSSGDDKGSAPDDGTCRWTYDRL